MSMFKGKKIVVVGLGRSGIAAARLLKAKGAHVGVTEEAQGSGRDAAALALRAKGVDVELGGHSRRFMEGSDMLVVSPGVHPQASPCLWAQESGIEMISEIELAFLCCPAIIIAVTGTNGKTTTTTLISEVLKAAGKKAYCLGNIGTPFSQDVLSMKSDEYVSLEVSSFQLEKIKAFHPKVAVILNVTPDHMDRYASMDEYYQAKKRICENQDTRDCLIINGKDAYLEKMAEGVKPRVVFFDRLGFKTEFNQNQLAVLAVAKVLGIKEEVVLSVFNIFKGVEHRMEYAGELDGVEFINDSKATNIDSTVWALNNIKKPAVLIAGGREKGSNFSSLKGLIRQKVKFVVLIGEAAEKIYEAWKEVLPCHKTGSLKEAVALAYQNAQTGDCVLLSPMCKSFDMFTDYEHRGRVFKEAVDHLRRIKLENRG